MRKNLLMLAIVLLCATSFVVVAAAQTSSTVLGKAEIKKGTRLGGVLLPGGNKAIPSTFIAYEDQVMYIIQILDAKPGKHNGGYMLSGDGFIHSCPIHGKEIMGNARMALSNDAVNSGAVTVIMFQRSGN
jgi:hypothetical protein